jgi:hypothetical protein
MAGLLTAASNSEGRIAVTLERGHALLTGFWSYSYIPQANSPITVEDARQIRAVLTNPRLCGIPLSKLLFCSTRPPPGATSWMLSTIWPRKPHLVIQYLFSIQAKANIGQTAFII